MKLLVDMNLSPRWVNLLTDAGIRAAHWSTLGAAEAPDTEIMAYARTNDYVVLTHDLDFGAILVPRFTLFFALSAARSGQPRGA
ncbi:MAG: DUF5615 family PIN-like protein [Candidatus Thiosymbion ectosymbiont of Robbea hypermnestra]|nr:DUF5615 family PIN-like protein [Candidatus Thiosymbion ectosymbiont of Robbea hypermnestra]